MRTLKLIILLLLSLKICAQKATVLSLHGDYGFLFLHSLDVAPIGQSYPRALNFDYSQWRISDANYQACNCYPRLGASMGWHYYNNQAVLGSGFPLYGYLEPWYKLSDRLFFHFRGGIGLSALTRPFDAQSNPLNLSYSLPVSAFVMVGAGFSVSLDAQWFLGLRGRYNHVSNGGIREPNKGLNYPTLALQLDYSLAPVGFNLSKGISDWRKQETRAFSVNSFWAAQAGATVGDAFNEQDVTYLVLGLSAHYHQQWARVSGFTAGLSIVQNYAYQDQIERVAGQEDSWQAAALLGHEFILGKFRFGQQAGFYLHKEYGAQADWFQRYYLLYYPWPNFGMGPALKAHAQVAEFLDFRFSYHFVF
jgi:hypothetical protein